MLRTRASGDARVAAVAALARIVAHEGPGPCGKNHRNDRRRKHHASPADRIYGDTQRYPGRNAPEASASERKARHQSKTRRLDPVRGELEHRHEGNAYARAHAQSSDADQAIPGRLGKHEGANRGQQPPGGQHASRTPVVDQHARRDLDGHIGIEVKGRKVAERHGSEREFSHQLTGNNGRRHALEEADQVQASPQAPDGQGQAHWRVLGRIGSGHWTCPHGNAAFGEHANYTCAVDTPLRRRRQ